MTVEATPKPELDTNIDRPEKNEVEKVLRKRKVLKKYGRSRNNKYLVMSKDYPIEEATWEPEPNFTDAAVLQHNLAKDQPSEVNPRKL